MVQATFIRVTGQRFIPGNNVSDFLYGKGHSQCYTVYYASIAGTLLELLAWSVSSFTKYYEWFLQVPKTLVSLHLFIVKQKVISLALNNSLCHIVS